LQGAVRFFGQACPHGSIIENHAAEKLCNIRHFECLLHFLFRLGG
jgi:hypothetical protein